MTTLIINELQTRLLRILEKRDTMGMLNLTASQPHLVDMSAEHFSHN